MITFLSINKCLFTDVHLWNQWLNFPHKILAPSDNFVQIRDHITFTSTQLDQHKLRSISILFQQNYKTVQLLCSYWKIKCQLIRHLWTYSILTVPACSFRILCPCLQCSRQPASINFNELQLYYFVLFFSCTNTVKQNKKK